MLRRRKRRVARGGHRHRLAERVGPKAQPTGVPQDLAFHSARISCLPPEPGVSDGQGMDRNETSTGLPEAWRFPSADHPPKRGGAGGAARLAANPKATGSDSRAGATERSRLAANAGAPVSESAVDGMAPSHLAEFRFGAASGFAWFHAARLVLILGSKADQLNRTGCGVVLAEGPWCSAIDSVGDNKVNQSLLQDASAAATKANFDEGSLWPVAFALKESPKRQGPARP